MRAAFGGLLRLYGRCVLRKRNSGQDRQRNRVNWKSYWHFAIPPECFFPGYIGAAQDKGLERLQYH
jgi:hypothetical protein